MATPPDAHMDKVFDAIVRGAGTAHLSDDAKKWLRDRYARWLDLPVPSQGQRTPRGVWNEHGAHFLEKLAEIGQKAAAASPGAPEISAQDATNTAIQVETDAACPWCLVNNPGA